MGDSNSATNTGTIIFFIISGGLILISLVLSLLFYRTKFSKNRLKKLNLMEGSSSLFEEDKNKKKVVRASSFRSSFAVDLPLAPNLKDWKFLKQVIWKTHPHPFLQYLVMA